MHRRIRSILAASAVVTLFAGAPAATAGPSGAIFTTNEGGTWVNGNVYDSKEDVYLNGGPRANHSCTAAGLPDGDYYFQVTDPSGSFLASTDVLGDRKIKILGGVIYAYLGTTHATGAGRCDAVTVALGRLDPLADPLLDPLLADTPNPGGEYKVWLTPVRDADTCDVLPVCAGTFLPSESKTDNFKVQAPEGIPD